MSRALPGQGPPRGPQVPGRRAWPGGGGSPADAGILVQGVVESGGWGRGGGRGQRDAVLSSVRISGEDFSASRMTFDTCLYSGGQRSWGSHLYYVAQ